MQKHVMKNDVFYIVPYHGPNITHLAHMDVLGIFVQDNGLSTEGATSRHLIIPVTVWSDWVYGLSTKTSCNTCISKNVSKNEYISLTLVF